MQGIRTVALATAASGALLAGCSGYGPRLTEERVLTADYDAPRPVRIESANGSVEVRRSDAPVIRVDATLYSRNLERLADAVVVLERDPEGVVIAVEWPGTRLGSEGCDMLISLPRATTLSVSTSNDHVFIDGVADEVDVRTSNDSVEIRDVPGRVDVRTSNDDVTVLGAGGPVDVQTSNDHVEVLLTRDNPGPVRISTSNSGVELSVGRAFSGILIADTSNGDIEVDGFWDRRERGGNSAELTFDREGEVSRIATSNADVEIEVRE